MALSSEIVSANHYTLYVNQRYLYETVTFFIAINTFFIAGGATLSLKTKIKEKILLARLASIRLAVFALVQASRDFAYC